MKSVVFVSFAGCFLLLNACATQTPLVTVPVTVTITSETATKQLINDVRNATLTAIGKQAPNARPVTVVATLYVAYIGEADFSHNSVYAGGSAMSRGGYSAGLSATGMSVPSTGSDPAGEGYIPTVGGYDTSASSLGSGPTRGPIFWMRVSYKIKDANGRVLESKQQWQPADRSRQGLEHIFPVLFDSARVADTAAYLASRVAALSK